jgi:ribonuclease III
MIRLAQLCKNLGYLFKDHNLLLQALRHRSVGKQSNERLEFLGDAVLNFIIAAELYRFYPAIREGELSRLRANLVNGGVLAELANELQIGMFLQFGSGELKSGGATRKSILADALEAVIGAIYLDSDIDHCRDRILAWFKNRIKHAGEAEQKDPKTRLQELLQMNKLPLPIYTVAATDGAAHSQTFHVECTVPGIDIKASGIGSNKRSAERNAAEHFLKTMTIKQNESKH